MCIKIILDWFKDNDNLPTPVDELTWAEVMTILKAEFPKAKIYLTDGKYKTTTVESFEEFLKNDNVDKRKYVSEFYDCDDFSFALMGAVSTPEWGAIAFGILFSDVPSGKHAVNCFIDSEREVWIVEPQTDAIFPLPDNWKPYFVLM